MSPMTAEPLFLITLAIGLALPTLWLFGQPLWADWRRRRTGEQPFPAAWRRLLRRHVPIVATLPSELQLQLKRQILVFLAEKPFIGCAGMRITDRVRVVIAAQACLLLMNRPAGGFAGLRQVLVYPGAFMVDRVSADGTGVQQERRRALAGESWSQGQVILSWSDVCEGAAVIDDGRNVVIHEFAHQLDQESGAANGAPFLGGRERHSHWSRVLGAEFERLRECVARGEPSLLSAYGATEPAEFFAVASEVFFEQPRQLAADAPALYAELSGCYRVDPLNW